MQLEMAGVNTPDDWASYAATLFDCGPPVAQLSDPARGLRRLAFAHDGRLTGALFISREPVLLSRGHVAALLGGDGSGALAGRPSAHQPDPGPTVCACLNVGINTISRAITTDGLLTVDAIGRALGAGTNCGSCRPELAALVARHSHREAAE